MKVPFSYLERQFADPTEYFNDIRVLLEGMDLTLGTEVEKFENRFAEFIGLPHAVGVGSGTDALILPLRLLGIGNGDEVITAANTFIATAGAIVATGAVPVFVDSEDGFVIDPSKIEAAISPATKAIIPVHYTGNMADMPAIMEIADRHNLLVIEDACQAIGAQLTGTPVGSWGHCAAFSLHPLKNINVWGDGGLVLTSDADFAEELRLYRNHGLVGRDHVEMFGVNSRLDSLQAVVGNRLIPDAGSITERRIKVAERYDAAFAQLGPEITVPKRRDGVRHVFHLYIIRATKRDELHAYLVDQGIEAKVHYPIPIHMQQAARSLGYKAGSFPNTEFDAANSITLPAHQHLTDKEIEHTIRQVTKFYRG